MKNSAALFGKVTRAHGAAVQFKAIRKARRCHR
jgi:hypothetical protein